MAQMESLDFKNKKVLVRVDFNVPIDKDNQVGDRTRIKAALPTLKKILNSGGSLILVSHLGRPKDGPEAKYSLRPLVEVIKQELGVDSVDFVDDCIGDQATHTAKNLQAGQVLLLENLRFYKQEEKGDPEFAKKLASFADIYVNDAFGTAHRAHASTSIIADFFEQKAMGYLMQSELDNADKIMQNPQKPYIAIMGGAKISDKIMIIERLLDKVDTLIIGGGMAYTFFAAQGGKIGKSLVETDKQELALSLLEKAKAKHVKILLPQDSITADAFDNSANIQISPSNQIEQEYMGLDIGPDAINEFSSAISSAKTILWNGPMGVFEMPNFAAGTKAIAHAVVQATQNGAYSLIGGGDSAAAINLLGYSDQVSYVSTGGGALLEYMEGRTLPGVEALRNS